MESFEKNGINGVERNDKKVDPLTKKDVQTILQMIPQGLDADEFVMRLANESVYYARWLGKAWLLIYLGIQGNVRPMRVFIGQNLPKWKSVTGKPVIC